MSSRRKTLADVLLAGCWLLAPGPVRSKRGASAEQAHEKYMRHWCAAARAERPIGAKGLKTERAELMRGDDWSRGSWLMLMIDQPTRAAGGGAVGELHAAARSNHEGSHISYESEISGRTAEGSPSTKVRIGVLGPPSLAG